MLILRPQSTFSVDKFKLIGDTKAMDEKYLKSAVKIQNNGNFKLKNGTVTQIMKNASFLVFALYSFPVFRFILGGFFRLIATFVFRCILKG
jgi:hypothetical protein